MDGQRNQYQRNNPRDYRNYSYDRNFGGQQNQYQNGLNPGAPQRKEIEPRNPPLRNNSNRINGVQKLQHTLNGDSTVWGEIYGTSINLLFDSGSVTTLMDEKIYRQKMKQIGSLRKSKDFLVGVGGADLNVLGEANVEIMIDGVVLPTRVKVVQDLAYDIIIGRDFMDKYEVNILFGSNMIHIKEARLHVPMEIERRSMDNKNDGQKHQSNYHEHQQNHTSSRQEAEGANKTPEDYLKEILGVPARRTQAILKSASFASQDDRQYNDQSYVNQHYDCYEQDDENIPEFDYQDFYPSSLYYINQQQSYVNPEKYDDKIIGDPKHQYSSSQYADNIPDPKKDKYQKSISEDVNLKTPVNENYDENDVEELHLEFATFDPEGLEEYLLAEYIETQKMDAVEQVEEVQPHGTIIPNNAIILNENEAFEESVIERQQQETVEWFTLYDENKDLWLIDGEDKEADKITAETTW